MLCIGACHGLFEWIYSFSGDPVFQNLLAWLKGDINWATFARFESLIPKPSLCIENWTKNNKRWNGYILDIPSFTKFSGLGFRPCQRLRLAHFPGVGRGLQASGALRNLPFWSSSYLESHSSCMGKESWFYILRGYRSRRCTCVHSASSPGHSVN